MKTPAAITRAARAALDKKAAEVVVLDLKRAILALVQATRGAAVAEAEHA